jgi:DNA-binding beta-propeller fold protein YncE
VKRLAALAGGAALVAALLAALLSAPAGTSAIVFAGAQDEPDDETGYEVWVVDQSDTTAGGGGTLRIYDGKTLGGRSPEDAAQAAETIDLGGAAEALCLARTGSVPRRPHMLQFNRGRTYAVLAYVASGHVLFLDAKTRAPVECIDVGVGAHAAFPAPNERYVVVANLAGKLLHRIATDFDTGTFALDPAATIDLASGTTPSGTLRQDPALRPDNAPVCPIVESKSRFTFVTLRGGGMFVVDSRATPMAIVAEYDRDTIDPSGCGGLETDGTMYVDSGGGWPANPLESDLYAIPLAGLSTRPAAPNTPAPSLVFSQDGDGAFADSHGAVLTRHDRYLWVADRAANKLVIVDTRTDRVVNEVGLAGSFSGDPAPDLLGISPSGTRIYVSLRGPAPLSGNVPLVDNAVGATPGVAVIRVKDGGASGELQAIVRIGHVVGGAERADPHGIAIRRR